MNEIELIELDTRIERSAKRKKDRIVDCSKEENKLKEDERKTKNKRNSAK